MANIIKKIYELQDIGKGVINSLQEENLLLLTPDIPIPIPGLEEIMESNNSIYTTQFTDVLPGGFWSIGGYGDDAAIITFQSDTGPGASFPTTAYGISDEFGFTTRAIEFYKERTEFKDETFSKGLIYAGDYEANFTARSLITRQFLENRTVTNPTSTALSAATLNSTYPGATIGFKVHALSISGGGLIYEKTSTGWCQHSATVVV